MKIKREQAWLFAFTDLAFLLLISLSLVSGKIEIDFERMEVPEVPANPNTEPINSPADVWMLQVRMVSEEHPEPFRIVAGTEENRSGRYVTRDDLVRELELLKTNGKRPILNPAGDSLSRDLLFAAGAIARVWSPDAGKAVIRPVDGGRQGKQ